MSLTDAYGLPVTAASRAAVDAYDRGVRALLGFGADTIGRLREALGHDPDFALARAALAVALYLDEKIPEGRAAMDARDGARRPRCPSASAATSRRSRSGSAAAATRRSGVIKAILAEHPRDVILLQRLYFIHFWQGRSADMLELTTGASADAFEERLLRARAPRVQPRGEPALRRGAGPGRAGDGARTRRTRGPCTPWPTCTTSAATTRRGVEALPPAHPSRAITSGTSRTTCSGTWPSCTWPRALRAGGAPLPERVRRHPDHRSAPTSRTRCRSRGGSTSFGQPDPRRWAHLGAAAARVARPAAPAVPRRPRGDGARRRGRLGVRRAAARAACASARQEDEERHAARGARAAPSRACTPSPAATTGRRCSGSSRSTPASSRWAAATPSASCSTTRSSPRPFAPDPRARAALLERRLAVRPNPGHYWEHSRAS